MQAQEMEAIKAPISRKANVNGGEGENDKQYGFEFWRENYVFQFQEGNKSQNLYRGKFRACLIMLFKQQFLVFKQYNTYFYNTF